MPRGEKRETNKTFQKTGKQTQREGAPLTFGPVFCHAPREQGVRRRGDNFQKQTFNDTISKERYIEQGEDKQYWMLETRKHRP